MKSYIIAFMTYSENILKQYLITAESRVDALDKFLRSQGYDLEIDVETYTVETIEELVFNMDCNISVFQL